MTTTDQAAVCEHPSAHFDFPDGPGEHWWCDVCGAHRCGTGCTEAES